ncbi:AAA family ATPase [Fimbriiglobus ruber]|uniref:Cell division protein FtsH n=1 Tax=Fimbriiglobus ruber TaxID=1908690 RepID=A0A225E4S2_9BACT|nr:AAA family ATPase [Fimbriiglobus ruber]OWK45086.1 Cell division protein FtsH [Fimbriiglobus ruber]
MMAQPAADEPPAGEPALLGRLLSHFARDPATLPVVEQEFATYERVNLQLALTEMLAEPQRASELLGVIVLEEYRSASLARMSRAGSAKNFDAGPVEYADLPLPGDRHLGCAKNGLYLIREDDHPLAVLLTEPAHSWQAQFGVEVMAVDRERAETFSRQLARRTRFGKAFRGHTLSLKQDCHGGLEVHFHHLPAISRDELILPDALLRRIERHTLSFNRHTEVLRAARRHLKRGLLLHGPPGTGKTLTAMYLVTQMPGRTVLILTGAGMGSVETVCKLARMLAPATVILEDVDLIGTQRNRQTVDANALLFELLNQMDGLADDTDILFVLTTNRPDILEPALAARPGRIDQAIEVPPPDADCRRRLFTLFGRGLDVAVENWDALIARTAGVSGAFIRELLRKAAVFAAEEGDGAELVVRDRHVEEALAELLVAGGPLTQSLLGATRAPQDEG